MKKTLLIDDEEGGYPLSPEKFRKMIADKILKLKDSISVRNMGERDADYCRGQIEAYKQALEVFNNKK